MDREELQQHLSENHGLAKGLVFTYKWCRDYHRRQHTDPTAVHLDHRHNDLDEVLPAGGVSPAELAYAFWEYLSLSAPTKADVERARAVLERSGVRNPHWWGR